MDDISTCPTANFQDLALRLSGLPETRDFREALWTPQAIQVGEDDTGRFELTRPETGYAALVGEFVYAHSTLPYYFSTNLRVVEGQDIRERARQTQASVNLR